VPAGTCAGATAYTYSGLRTPSSTIADAIRPFTFTNASLWQIKLGVRLRF
jgi:hypothetical protein